MASYLCSQEEILELAFGSWQQFLLGCQPWGLLHDFSMKSSEFAFPDPLQISWFLSAENPHPPWISLVNVEGTFLMNKKMSLLLAAPGLSEDFFMDIL